MALGTSAASPDPKAIVLTLEGKPLKSQGVLLDGTTYVAVKELGTELGFVVTGTYVDDTVIVCRGKNKVQLEEGHLNAVVNGHETWMSEKPMLIDDRVMVPLRFLMENLGYNVNWKGGTPSVIDMTPRNENDLIIGTIRERQETAKLSVDIQYPKIAGLPEEIQDPMNRYFAGRFDGVRTQANDSEKASIEYGSTGWQTELIVNYNVTYNENGLLCILFDDYLYQGGAHGGTIRTGYTADIGTGKAYALKDLFKPDTDYVSILSAEVVRQMEENDLTPITITPFSSIRPDQDFYIKDNSLVVYFQQYELMAYAYGFPEFRIPMASLEEVLVPELAAIGWAAN